MRLAACLLLTLVSILHGGFAYQPYSLPGKQTASLCLKGGSACTKVPCCSGAHQNAGCRLCDSSGEWVVKGASLQGDIFTDFSGRRFKFNSEDEESYNLFTEADHQLNAVISSSASQARHLGLTLRGVGIHGPDTRVQIANADNNDIEVELNERVFRDDVTRLDGVIVLTSCLKNESANGTCQKTVTVKDRFLTLTAWMAAPIVVGETRSIAFNLSLTEHPMSQVHGILGQSLDDGGLSANVSMPSNLQFYGEGQISDYSTTDIFSSDSTFSIFTRKAERRRQKRKRQMLEGNALASMAFAAKAESGALALSEKRRRFPRD